MDAMLILRKWRYMNEGVAGVEPVTKGERLKNCMEEKPR